MKYNVVKYTVLDEGAWERQANGLGHFDLPYNVS